MFKTLNYLFVTCFGIGSFRFAPGTITSLITTVFLYSLFHLINLSNNTILVILLIVFIYSFYAVSEYIKYNENKDPNEVVVDAFLKDKIGFLEMSDVIADCMEKSTFVANPTYDDFVSSDEESRVLANALI